jgi:nicotinamidase-related amidase
MQGQEAEKSKIMILVVGMQRDKMNAMMLPYYEKIAADETEAAVGGGRTAMPPNLLENVNSCIELGLSNERSNWKVVHALDLHHPKHCSFAFSVLPENDGRVSASVGPHHYLRSKHCVLGTWGADMVTGMHYGIIREKSHAHSEDDAKEDLVFRGLYLDGDSDNAFWITEPPHPEAVPSRLSQMISSMLSAADASAKDKKNKKNHAAAASQQKATLIMCGTSPDGCIENTCAEAQRLFPSLRVCIVREATWLRSSSHLSGVEEVSLSELLLM